LQNLNTSLETSQLSTPPELSIEPTGSGSLGKKKRKVTQPNRDLKWGIWAYVLLLIFEGALRKWFLPFLSTPLLVVRDPIALWLVVTAISRGALKLNGYIVTMGSLGILGTFTALTLGHGNLPVAIYGARIFLIHFPLIFVIGKVLDRSDVLQIGRMVIWVAIPMTVLIALQFYSPQSAWVNRGVGGDMEGAGFGGALGYFRPPGTFAFTNGTTLFYSILASFIFFFWLEAKTISKAALLLATAGLLAAIPLSISRGLLFQVLVSLTFLALATARNPKFLAKLLLGFTAAGIAFATLSTTPLFETATQAFTARFESASGSEGGLKGTLGDRFLGGLISAVLESGDQPIMGYGLGMGTNVGSMLLAGTTTFLIAEGEWARVVGELGSIFGLIVIGCRLALSAELAFKSYRRLINGDLLPWLLLSFGILAVSQGNWAQPTSLGFSTLSGGLLLAALSKPKKQRRTAQPPVSSSLPAETDAQGSEISTPSPMVG
jgi:hypothetical protein